MGLKPAKFAIPAATGGIGLPLPDSSALDAAAPGGRRLEPRQADMRLRRAGLRTTKQRVILAEILFADGMNRHVTAESLFAAASAQGAKLSLATVYNCLHQFTAAGLLRMVGVDGGRSYFDTNLTPHHHFYHESTGDLQDIPEGDVQLARLPQPPEGRSIRHVDVIVRLKD